MIRKLKRKFIALALTALFVLLAIIVLGMNLLNYRSVVKEADSTLELLSENKGKFPGFDGAPRPMWLPKDMSPETPYESRYFTVVFDEEQTTVYIDLNRITIDQATAVDYAVEAYEANRDSGFVGDFRYFKVAEGSNTRIILLDCGRKLDIFHDFVKFSVLISLIGYVITALVICIVAGRFVRPVAESQERQKRFITDAGHEIKTPLTIISANVDLLQMELGDENESLKDIRQQAERLTGLTNDLVYLSKMEESQSKLTMVDFPVSEIVTEAAEQFKTLAQAQGKELNCNIQPMLTLNGNDKAISKLVSLLLDNAMKYSDQGSQIDLFLEKQGRKIMLTVGNISAVPISQDSLKHVFERFYRPDASRNSETGGHGIGLSTAQAIVEDHGGKIAAASPDGRAFIITAAFPG